MKKDLFTCEFIERGYGLVLKTEFPEHYERSLEKSNVLIGDETLIPGKETTLGDWFNLKPTVYLGMDDKYMVFQQGEIDGFTYYLKIFRVTETRIFCHLVRNGGRDFNYINGSWDWNRKKGDYGKRGKNKAA